MFFILDRRSFFDLAGQHAPWTALPITSAGRFSPLGWWASEGTKSLMKDGAAVPDNLPFYPIAPVDKCDS